MQTPSVVKAILDKVAGFFDILDLSFFVSGAVCLSGFVYALSPDPFPVFERLLDQGYKIGAALVASYVLGLVCFSLGRWLRSALTLRGRTASKPSVSKRWAALAKLLRTHGLAKLGPYAAYGIDEEDETFSHRMEGLYTRLWAELRQDKELAPSFDLVRKYWVMAATCDGLVAALLVWGGASLVRLVVAATAQGAPPTAGALAITSLQVIFFLLATRTCAREAHRLSVYQAEEVVATLAHRRVTAQPPAPAPAPPATAGTNAAVPGAVESAAATEGGQDPTQGS